MQNKFNKSEIAFIQKISKQGFKTQTYYDTFRTELKIHKICTKLHVNSIEEIIRQVLFYGWFELDITEDYRSYALNRARDYITITRVVRNQMLEFAKNVPQPFGELCTHSACLNDEELKDRADMLISAVKNDEESYRLFSTVRSFVDLIGNKYNFKMIFDNIFYVEEDDIEDINKAEQLLQSKVANYLMRVRMCIDSAFPIRRKREITPKEKELVNFLLYKGDEIDYMEQYSLSAKDFEGKLNSLYEVYGVLDTPELLIAASVEETFLESSLVYESFFLNLRANLLLNDRENLMAELPYDKKNELNKLFEELKKFTLKDFLTPNTMQKFDGILDKYKDCDFTTVGKTDEFKTWYYNNIQSKDDVKMLMNTLRKIDKIMQF